MSLSQTPQSGLRPEALGLMLLSFSLHRVSDLMTCVSAGLAQPGTLLVCKGRKKPTYLLKKQKFKKVITF